MAQDGKPRSIRDIAHLYISRSKASASSGLVCVAGEDTRCFSGFHAANLAASFSLSGSPVRVIDRSGLLPNAGYFLLAPSSESFPRAGSSLRTVMGMAGIEIQFLRAGSAERSHPAADRLEIIHLPPLSRPEHFANELGGALGVEKAPALFVLLGTRFGRRSSLMDLVGKAWGPDAIALLQVREAQPPAAGEIDAAPGGPAGLETAGPDPISLGSVVGWEDLLGEGMAPPLRDPDAEFSRAYRSVAETVRFELKRLEKISGGLSSFDVIAGAGSGTRD